MTRQEILDKISQLDARERQLSAEVRQMLRSTTGVIGTWIAGTLTVGGIAASWATLGISLGVSILGTAWFVKETVDKAKADNRLKKIEEEIDAIGQQKENLRVLLPTAPPP